MTWVLLLNLVQQQTQQQASSPWEQYGIPGLIIAFLIRDIIPWLRDTFSDTHKARLAQEAEDRKQEREQKQLVARMLERTGDALHTTTLAMTVLTERITNVERNQDKVGDALEHIDKYLGILVDRQQQGTQQRTVGRQPPSKG